MSVSERKGSGEGRLKVLMLQKLLVATAGKNVGASPHKASKLSSDFTLNAHYDRAVPKTCNLQCRQSHPQRMVIMQ